LLAPLGVTERSEPFIDKIDNPESQRSLAAPYIVFHMWPSGVTHTHLKRWPENYWASLAEACIERGRRVVLTGGRQDVGPTRQWMARFDSENKIDDRAGISIRETIFILQNAEGVVSVNTGVMHLAAALGVPTVGLHGPTNAKRWGPIGERAMSLKVPSPHGAYLSLGFEYPADADARDGMETIGVRDVLLALAKFIPDFQIRVPSKAAELVEA
jgi:heptosyltransferase III